jgi:WD40 repeat protein
VSDGPPHFCWISKVYFVPCWISTHPSSLFSKINTLYFSTMPASTPRKKKSPKEVGSATPNKKDVSKRRRQSSSGDDFATPETKAKPTREVKSTTAKRESARKSRRRADSAEKSVLETHSTPEKIPKSKSPKSTSKKAVKSPVKQKTPKKKDATPTTEVKKDSTTEKKRRRSPSTEPPIEKPAIVIAEPTTTTPKKADPTMDVQVHRLRHLDYIPSPVLAMSANRDGYLAMSRENGSYELRKVSSIEEYRGQFTPHIYPLAQIAGSTRAVAHSLCWVAGGASPSCVAASPDGTLWMVNFSRSQLQCRLNSGGGGIFDLSTCQGTTELPVVAAACQDGSIRLWQVRNHKIIDPPVATLPTAGAAVLSLSWRLVQQTGDSHETVLFAGVADGTIRKYRVDLTVPSMHDGDDGDMVSLTKPVSPILRMTVESRGRRTATKVWTMQSMQDGTLVTGNSLGQVQFWNAETGTLMQSMNQTELKADVLKVVVNRDETKVFASGIDSRVVCMERRPGDQQWRFTTAQRPHTHDVKAMTIIPSSSDNNDNRLETLTTAGVDTKLCSYVVSDFSKRRPQVWYPWPSVSPITTAGNQMLSMQRDNHVDLYRLTKASDNKSVQTSSSQLIGEIAIETQSNLVTSSLSPSGKWLAMCNASALFVFRLDFSDGDVEPQKLTLPKELERLCVVALHFYENTMFVADSSNMLYVVDLEDEAMGYTTLGIQTAPNDKDRLPVHSMHTSKNGKYLVTMSKLSENGIHIFQLKGSSYHPYWTIPSLAGSSPAALTLIEDDQLAVATFTSHVYIFDLDLQKLSPWSEQHGFPIQKWPVELMSRKDFPVRLTVNPSDPTQLILVSLL